MTAVDAVNWGRICMLSSEGIRQTAGLTFRMMGNLALEDDRGNNIKVTNRKACGLLAYLALNDKPTETRERLAGLLWSDRSEEQARASLRQCLKQLRGVFDALGFAGFTTDRQDVSLAQDQIKIDVRDIARSLTDGKVPERLLSEGGDPQRMLYGLETLDQSFAAWLHVIRQSWHGRLVERLQTLLKSGPDETARRAAEALVRIDPSHEEARRHLIRQYADDGNTTAALSQYKVLWELLDEEFDMEPDDETLALIADIKAGTYVRPERNTETAHMGGGNLVAASSHSAAPAIDAADQTLVRYPVLQVRRFAPGGPTKDGASLVEGFRRDLLASLVRFRDWVVVGADHSTVDGTSSDSGNDKIQYQVDGTYFDDEGKTHLIVTLKSRQSGQYIWSERFKLTLDNWFAAQRRFVMRVSAGLSINLTAQHIAQHITEHEIPADTYSLWLEAYRLIWSWDPSERESAESMFRQIIERCPSFAPAYSGLASIYNTEQVVYPGVNPDTRRLSEAARMAQIAVSLDPLDVRNQVALAWSYAMIGRFDHSQIHHRLVRELNPNNPITLISCANGLAMCGDLEMAADMTNNAIAVLPSITPVQWAYIASTRFICGDDLGCVEASDLARDSVPMVSGWRAAALGRLGSTKSAVAAGKHFVGVTRRHWATGHAPSNADIANWFLYHCPLRSKETRQSMREGLANAGLSINRRLD